MRRIMRPSADDAGQPAAAAPETQAPIGEPNPGANPFARPADAATAQPADGDAAQPADAGAEAQATDAGAVERAEAQAGSATDETAVLPAVEPQAAEERPGSEGEQPPKEKRRLFGRRRAEAPFVLEETPPPAVAEAAVVLPKPEGPAGLDPAEAEMRPPAGRRGRLRRRLRYLRRARELMLRDLGGLVYEIHRTGGGDMASHAPVVSGKVDRIGQVDAESVALETALRAPRGETVVFQPGIGGTCVACGDLYPSDARFCANCGRSTTEPPVTEAGAAAAEPSPVDPRGTLNLFAPLEAERTAPAEEPAAVEMPAAHPAVSEPATAEEPTQTGEPAAASADEPTHTGDPGALPAEEPTQAGEPAAPRHEPGVNGTAPPTLQPGDPLASRERS